ncbi:CBS domain-containing protein [Cytophagaceae bacterium ABcell3]|nr:CBS domain-containing protein [Cytophagaceae bacterium ABcell3]
MTAEELINHMMPPLKPSDTTAMALNWMKEFRVEQLVLVDNGTYKGIISEETLLGANDSEKPLSEYPLQHEEVYATPQAHFYELIKLAGQHKLQLLAVVDDDKKFLGIISINDTASATAQLFASQSPGGILVLAVRQRDYSLAEISRLVEENGVKILSAFVMDDENEPDLLKLTLKLNKEDLSRVIATLERYQYAIVAHFQESDFMNNDKERLDLLFRYLNI